MKSIVAAVLLACCWLAGSGGQVAQGAEAELLKIDPAQSNFSVHVSRSGLFKMFGHDHNISIKEFSGKVQFTPSTIEPASLEMTVKAASLTVTDQVSTSDKTKIEQTMKASVLETDKYPDILFKCTKTHVTKGANGHYKARLLGELTMHGVTRPLALDGDLEISEHRLRAIGAFALKQSEFGIKRVKVAGGTVTVKDELKLTFDIVAHP